ncbi:MAG: SMP-30/gluconolactonase/LRE family protein [Chloroflexi bacterium]|nr:SMP-30/gluconolactonase/LRE family protein [Chloroflexota bacterium]
MTLELSLLQTVAGGLDHPEGIAYARDGHLYASGEGGQVYRISIENKTAQQFASTGGFGLGIAIDHQSNLYVCDMGVHAVVRVRPDGSTSTYATGTADNPLQVPNYPVFDERGNLYVSDSRGWGQKNGLIYRFTPSGEAQVWCTTASGYTNGMALSLDRSHLYVVESIPARISRVPIRADGSAGVVELVVELPKTVPDGIAFDERGNLYISCYSPDRIYRYTAAGLLEILFDDWSRISLNAPTNVAFAGQDLERMAISSLGGYSIAWAEVGARGSRLCYPTL